jgi:hypothetical protein
VAAKNQVQMSLLFMHLANLGYGILSREDNPYNQLGCCSEYSFLRVETTPLAQRAAAMNGVIRRAGGNVQMRLQATAAAGAAVA